MTEVAADPGPTTWLSIDDTAGRLQMPASRVRQLVADGALVAVRRHGADRVPADFLSPDSPATVVKGLAGTLTLLRDVGYSAAEALAWLYTPDDALPGTPIEALRANRGTEIKRRAQAAGF